MIVRVQKLKYCVIPPRTNCRLIEQNIENKTINNMYTNVRWKRDDFFNDWLWVKSGNAKKYEL